MCFSSTLLPTPLLPMTTVIWPVGTVQVDAVQHLLAVEGFVQVDELNILYQWLSSQ